MAAPKDGSGPVEALGEWYGKDLQSHLVATDAQFVYRRYDSKIIRMNRVNRELTEIELGVGHVQGSMMADSDFLYVVDRDCSGFVLVDKSSLAVNVVPIPGGGQEPGGSTRIAMDEQDVFCSHGQFVHAISKQDRSIRDIVQDSDETDGFGAVASDGKMLFWFNYPQVLGTGTESLFRRSKGGGSVEKLAVFGSNAGQLQLDTARGWLYTIATNPVGAPLLGYSLAKNELHELAINQPASGGITFDSKYIYWTLDRIDGEGGIMRMKAPEGG